MTLTIKGIVYAVFAAFCFGIMPILTKLLYGETGVDPFFFLMIRYSCAAILIWTYLFATGNSNWQKINKSGFLLIFMTSVSYIIVTATYFIALKYINASLNSLLVFTFPIFTPFLGFLFFKEKLRLVPVIAALVGCIGCAMLISGYQLNGLPGESLGITLGLVSGVIYALYTLFGQKVTVQIEPIIVVALNVSIVAVFFICTRLTWLWERPQPLKVYLVAGIIGLVSTILANLFYFKAIQAVGAVKAGIFSSLEPFFTTVLAILFLNEIINFQQWMGAILIVGGMIIVQQPWKRALRPSFSDKPEEF